MKQAIVDGQLALRLLRKNERRKDKKKYRIVLLLFNRVKKETKLVFIAVDSQRAFHSQKNQPKIIYTTINLFISFPFMFLYHDKIF